ncbi:MAG: CheR family methyltransferase, partial [Verrucomicrobiota bacterium]
ATGEEVYSLAIIIDEQIQQAQQQRRWKIFATDVHPESLELASLGEYHANAIAEVSKQRLDTYFTQVNDRFQVKRALRENVVFASHNLLRDPPFTKMHLITCRNLLIYFSPEAQRRILKMFSFALQDQGALFLGSSESVGEHADEFDVVGKTERIFRKNGVMPYSPGTVPSQTENYRKNTNPKKSANLPRTGPTYEVLEQLLAAHIESGVLIDDEGFITYSIGETRDLLRPPAGRMSNKLVDMLPASLKVTVASAIHQAQRREQRVVFESEIQDEEAQRKIEVTIDPLSQFGGERFTFVVLKPYEEVRRTGEPIDFNNDEASENRIRELESELKVSQEGMQNVVEELETSNEELQSTNEELIASNEELQSTNEELQSVNEELYTVNSEFDSKNRELAELNSDLDTLLKSTRIGVIFLDEKLNIRKFTPSAASAIHLLDTDVSRPLSHVTNNLEINPDILTQMAESVFSTRQEIEQEVKSRDGHWYLMKLLPFTDAIGNVGGVVLTFVDINQTKEAQRLREFEAQRQLIIGDAVDTMVWLHLDKEGRCVEEHPSWEKFTGQAWPSYQNFGWQEVIHDSDRPEIKISVGKSIEGHQHFTPSSFRIYHHPSADFHQCESEFWPIITGNRHEGWVACFKDIHESQIAIAELEHQKSILDSIVNNSSAAISVKDLEKRYILINQYMLELIGLEEPAEAIGKSVEELLNNEVVNIIDEHDDHVLSTGRNRTFEAYINPNNPEIPYSITKFPLRSPEGTIEGVVGIATDLSDVKRQQQLRRQTDELSRVNLELALRNKELDDYANIISHDLKQPLRTIYALAEMLEEELGSDLAEDAADYLRRISRASGKLRRMIDGILDYSRSGRDDLDLQVCQVGELVNEVIESLETDLNREGVRAEVSQGLPEINADRTMLYQIFQNLIANAIKFTNADSPTFWVRHQSNEAEHVFFVEDNGIGIEPEFRESIFRPFERLNSEEAYPGTGIGLSIAQRLVERHGGSISALDREAGPGTSFRFTLPINSRSLVKV